MKPTMSLLLAVLLLLGALPVLAEFPSGEATDDNILKIHAVVKAFLEQQELTYTEDEDVYRLNFTLANSLGGCETRIYVYYDQVAVVSSPDINVREENRNLMAKYLTLANWETFYTQFRMDYEDGQIACRSAQSVESVIPGLSEIGVLVYMTVHSLNDFGEGIAQVALMGADPQTAFDEAMEKLNAE